MQKTFNKKLNSIIKELSKQKLLYISVTTVLLGALFIRVYRVGEILGFYFDQGRDALVIWDFLTKGKIFLIGPTTGIAGIFRGPFYYYLISPFYWVGNGNPVFPAVFLAVLSVIALALLFWLAKKVAGTSAGFISIIISGFSFYIILASRWLSNPTPMLILSMLLLVTMYLIIEKKMWAWVLLSAVAGISLFHFGSSGEFFYFPAIFIFFVWQTKLFSKKRNLPSLKIVILSLLTFFLTAAPLLIFDLRHEHILFNNIKSFLFERGSFKSNFWDVFNQRLDFYYSVFSSKIFETRNTRESILLLVPFVALLIKSRELLKNKYFLATVILFLSPIIGLLFFQGNEGNIYDYYLTGYYLVFILLFSIGLSAMYRFSLGKIFIIYFFIVFLQSNLNITFSRLNDGGDGQNTIVFLNQKKALDWIYADAKGENFNTDFYVPPVIPYSYLYLMEWYSQSREGWVPNDNLPLLYTLYEEDPPHPERLKAWSTRQEGIGKVLYQQKYGGITVQRRERLQSSADKTN